MTTRKKKSHEDTWTAVFEDGQADDEGYYPAEIKRSDGSEVIHCDIFSNGPDALRALARELAHVLAGCAVYGDFNPKVPLDTDVCWTDDPACLRGDTEGWCSTVRSVLARAVAAGLFD